MPFALHLTTRAARLSAFSLFYLSEGIPVGFTTVALTAYLRREGAGLAEVSAITAAVYAPWGFKWAWAPLVDMLRNRRFGPSRAWILFAQVMMIVTFAALLTMNPVGNITLLTTLIVIHNIFAATQDVAIDAMAVRVLPPSEVGTANGFMFGAQYAGAGLGGSGALYVAGAFGFTASFYFILALMGLILLFVTIPLREPPDPVAPPRTTSALAAIAERVRLFFRELGRGFFRSGRAPSLGVVFAILPPAATALGLSLATAMQVDLKMSEQLIGTVAILTNVGGALGCVAGGWISDRTGRPRTCLAVFYALTVAPTVFLATRFTGSGVEGLTVSTFVATTVVYMFVYGMQRGTVSAFYMRITNPGVAATQFTGYMALMNLAISYSSVWQGRYSEAHGYGPMLYLDAAVALIALLVLPFMSQRGAANHVLN